MHCYLPGSKINLTWKGEIPGNGKKTALLIPQYNEGSNGQFEKRLGYFSSLSKRYKDKLDVIIIDDGSTDDSLSRLIKYKEKHSDTFFFIASIHPNGNKVGALCMTSEAISHDIIILSDFDTDLAGIETLIVSKSGSLKEDPSLMGYYFRMLPYEGSGPVFLYQQLEYTLQRVLYRFHQKERSIRVMPGAGSCYKRDVLNSIYKQHSGLRNGEDREATLIGLRLGYKTVYLNSIQALTRPPLSFRALVKQRIRWNLGYLETFSKESKYYVSEVSRLTRIGIVTLIDVMNVIFVLLFPYIALLIGIGSLNALLIFSAGIYVCAIGWCLNLILRSPEESEEFKEKRLNSILFYPFFKLLLEYLAWTGAFYKMIKMQFRKK